MAARRRFMTALACLGVLLTACSSGALADEEPTQPPAPEAPSASAVTEGDDAATAQPAAETPDAAPADSCDWETAALEVGPTPASGQDGDLMRHIVGAWQHTHIDSGGGFEPVGIDIRYVFPDQSRLLYCQHVVGVTEQAENRADVAWDEHTIVLHGTPGYTVTDWNADTMVWQNHFDGSIYLLHRR